MQKSNVDPVIGENSSSENGKIKIIFQKNGLGIDLKSKGDKIFGLYKRFHSHVEGKGLGLFMVKTEVESLGGTINIMSEPDKGTMFYD
ncbi:MAG: HAMP domain-containing histidine kinase [Bacteroidetes bacterium]|nr:HAMP domain-containing histidine kinase [Bacteroidota bacterium]